MKFDYLPETADQLINNFLRCSCRWDYVPAPDDIDAAKEFHRYPRSLLRITFSLTCQKYKHRKLAANGYYQITDFGHDSYDEVISKLFLTDERSEPNIIT